MADLSIGEAARRVGLRPSALRYYEHIGLLPAPRRVNGRRRYDEQSLRLLGVLQLAQKAGFTMAEIQTLFHGFAPGVPPAARWQTLGVKKMQELDDLIARARQMKAFLESALRCNCLQLEECAAHWEPGRDGA